MSADIMDDAPQVDWSSETDCFETFLRELAYFYAPWSLDGDQPNSPEDSETDSHIKAENWKVQHVLFPAMRRYLVPPRKYMEDVVQVANLPDLYRVFERC